MLVLYQALLQALGIHQRTKQTGISALLGLTFSVIKICNVSYKHTLMATFLLFFFFFFFFFNAILVCLHSFYVCMYVCMYGCVGSSFLCEGFL